MVDAHVAGCPADAATLQGLEILDELCVTLLECFPVAQAAADEVDLNLDELLAGLGALQHPARAAYRAASLVHQGATLDESWSTTRSRPKAIFARHHSAVRAGARPVAAAEPSVSRFEDALHAGDTVDCSQNLTGPRPGCVSLTATTADRCKNSAIYLGSGTFAQHCYTHLTPLERQQFNQHRHDIALQERTVAHVRFERTWQATDLVITEWHRRRCGRRWPEDLADVC